MSMKLCTATVHAWYNVINYDSECEAAPNGDNMDSTWSDGDSTAVGTLVQ